MSASEEKKKTVEHFRNSLEEKLRDIGKKRKGNAMREK